MNIDIELEKIKASPYFIGTCVPYINSLKTRDEIVACLHEYYAFCCSHVTIDGMWLEFGTWTGSTLKVLASHTTNMVYGFDSFEGLPEDWVRDENDRTLTVPRGSFTTGSFEAIEQSLAHIKNISLIKGLFNDSLQPFLDTHLGNCALIHIDCDLYSSTKTVLSLLKSRIIKGTVILFDELIGYKDFAKHEFKALMELDIEYEYIAHAAEQQVGLKVI